MTTTTVYYKLLFTSHNTDESCIHQFITVTDEQEESETDFFYVQETPYELIVDGVETTTIPRWLAPYLVHFKG